MTENTTAEPPKAVTWRKLAVQALIGAVVGAGAMTATLELIDRADGPEWGPSRIILVGVGLVYFVMGLFVGIGSLAPRSIGQRLLNVADAEELVDERGNLVGSAVGCMAMGGALALLAYAASGAPAAIAPVAAFWIFVAVLAGLVAISIAMWRNFDELWRQLSSDASALLGNALIVVLGIWGAAAGFGLTAGPQPLDLVSLVFGGILVATFIAVWRRGMAAPR